MKFIVFRRQFFNPVEASFGRGSISKTLPKDLGLEKSGPGGPGSRQEDRFETGEGVWGGGQCCDMNSMN